MHMIRKEPAANPGASLSLERHRPYLLAAAYLVAASAFFVVFFPDQPPPRFMDLYLIGIAFFCAFWSLGPGLLIYVGSLLFATWILPPAGSLRISEGYDIYRMTSYSVVAFAVILIIRKLKSSD
jgi:hypothetical protein